MSPEKSPSASSRSLRVLLVEDDGPIQLLIDTMLRRSGVELEITGDGQAALDRMRERTFDAVLLDLMLPGVSGFDVVRDMKRRQPHMLSRTIVLTAASEVTLKGFEDGNLVHRVMRKPFDVTELLDEVALCGAGGGKVEVLP